MSNPVPMRGRARPLLSVAAVVSLAACGSRAPATSGSESAATRDAGSAPSASVASPPSVTPRLLPSGSPAPGNVPSKGAPPGLPDAR
jgi:hypothetical protein